MNKLGYAMKEMIMLSAILAIVFMIGIGRVSYAYEEADRSDEIANIEKSYLLDAAKIYVDKHKDEIKDKETFFYGSDFIDDGILMNTDVANYQNAKVKVTMHEDGKYDVEIVE